MKYKFPSIFLFVIVIFSVSQCSMKKQLKASKGLEVTHKSKLVLDINFSLTDDAELAIQDFNSILGKIDHQETPQLLISNDLNSLPDQSMVNKLKNNRQAYYLHMGANRILTIYAIHSLGVQYGIYGYLSRLGYKWYFPGDLWTISPEINSWHIDISELGRPDFRGRRFFGGGGFPRGHVADPDNYVMTSWNSWTRRNRFGADYISKGHAWQDFIRRNKDVLARHPEYLSKSGKQLCVTNLELQNLFIEDRVKRIAQNRKRYGFQDPRALTVGVEPNDGGEHCDCEKCNRLGSISNRVFYLANIVAKAIHSKYSDVKVSVMAYNEHAATPDFPLEKNIQVSVVPYAYQDVAAPEELLKQWSKKHHDIQVRDYWGVVIWTRGYPVKNFMNLAQNRIQQWDRLGVNMMMVESSYSIGMAGIPLYLLSQIGWDKSYNVDKNLTLLFTDLFGAKAGVVMRDMMQRWSDTGLIIEFEQSLTPRDLAKAMKLAKTTKQRQRIEAFEDYFNFLLLQENIKTAKPESPERKKELAGLLDYSYSIMDGLMIHSYWMPSPMSRLYDRKNYTTKEVRVAEKNRGKSYYSNLRKRDFKKIMPKENATVKKVLQERMYEDNTKISNNVWKEIPNRERLIKTGKSFTLKHSAKGPSEYTYDIEVTTRRKSLKKNATIISLFDSDNNIISTKRYIPGKQYKSEKIRIPKKGDYEIRIRSSNVSAEIIWKRSKGIELVPGTLVDFGEYYLYTLSSGDLVVRGNQKTDLFVQDRKCKVVKNKNLLEFNILKDQNLIRVKSKDVIVPFFNCNIYL